MQQTVVVDVWSDIACPWCWIGKRNLDRALEETIGDGATIHWRAFELDPQAPRQPPEPVDYAERLARKYGTDRVRAREMIDRMVERGRSAGVELRFDRIRPSNTFDAHRLVAWAGDSGRGSEMEERLFSAYLSEGRPIADLDELARLASDAGFDGDEARAVLDGDRYAAQVREDEEVARRLGIEGVPYFVFERRLAVAGAQPPAVLAQGIEQARKGRPADS